MDTLRMVGRLLLAVLCIAYALLALEAAFSKSPYVNDMGRGYRRRGDARLWYPTTARRLWDGVLGVAGLASAIWLIVEAL